MRNYYLIDDIETSTRARRVGGYSFSLFGYTNFKVAKSIVIKKWRNLKPKDRPKIITLRG